MEWVVRQLMMEKSAQLYFSSIYEASLWVDIHVSQSFIFHVKPLIFLRFDNLFYAISSDSHQTTFVENEI